MNMSAQRPFPMAITHCENISLVSIDQTQRRKVKTSESDEMNETAVAVRMQGAMHLVGT